MPGFTAHMPGFTAERSLDWTTPAYRDGLRAIPPDGVLRPAQLSILDYISPLRTDSLPLVSKIYWRQSADDAIMYAP
jgi:hypothetical protein